MEKIYTDEKKDKSIFQQIFKTQLSKKLSVAMIIVSFFSFMMMGVTVVSYAAVPQIPESGLGDSFTTADPGTQVWGEGLGQRIPIFMYSTKENGYPIYCMERNVGYVAGTSMSKAEKITDQGLLYIMANVAPHKKFVDESGNVFPDEVQTWLSQATIWQYLYEKNVVGNEGNSDSSSIDMDALKTVTKITWGDDVLNENACTMAGCDGQESSKSFYTERIAPLVNNAKQSNVSANGTITLSITNDQISVSSDEKYYLTSKVTIGTTNGSNLVEGSVNVEISSAPKGTVLVNENGEEIKDVSNLSEFYVKVPIENVTEDNKVVSLSATGKFRGYDGYYYRADGAQTVSSVYTTDIPTSTGLDIPLNYTPEVPPTGMNLAQSIYFIGLVVLLCGVGIIYANVKPKTRQQQ